MNSEERLAQLDGELDASDNKIGMPSWLPVTTEDEAKRLLVLEPEQLKRMTPLDCSEAAFILNQFAFQLQRAMNREQARVRWAEESIRKIIAPYLAEQRAYSFDERKLLAVRANDAAQKLDKIRVHHQLRLDRISFLSAKTESMARSMVSLSQTKRGAS